MGAARIIQPPSGMPIDWTPVIVGTTTPGSTIVYNTRTAWYTRQGKLITFLAFINLASHDGTGNMEIGGLPFPNIALNTPIDINVSALTWSNTLQGYVKASSSNIVLATVATTTGETALALDTACALRLRGQYFTP